MATMPIQPPHLLDVLRGQPGYGPPPTPVTAVKRQTAHGNLIDAVHGQIAQHPHPARKASYAKILAILLGDQAKEHAAGPSANGMGGAQAPEDNGLGGQMAGMPPTGHQLAGGFVNQPDPLQAILAARMQQAQQPHNPILDILARGYA